MTGRHSGVRTGCCILVLLSVGVVSCYGQATATTTATEFFKEQVQPILVDKCLPCHGADRKGGLDLRSRESFWRGGDEGRVFEQGQPDESALIQYVEAEEMPPDAPLAAEQIEVLRTWITRGAYFPDGKLDPFASSSARRAGYDWWAFQPLGEFSPPIIADMPSAWRADPIDRLVYHQLKHSQLEPNERADRRTLIRRATYDLTGLPPTFAEVEAFVADPSPHAYARLIDRLLESPHYGERWGRHWLDVVRFGESNGFERNQIIDNAWPFRDFVIRSFNEDKPFDQFILEHLAGDVIAAGDPQREVGTTFLVCGPYDDVTNQDPVQAAQIRANTIDEMIRATSEAFLGLTVGCARCHDHKFDPVTQSDYYSLYATFAGVHHGSRTVATAQQQQRHRDQLAPFQQRQGELEKELAVLDQQIATAAEAQAAEIESQWTRPPIDRRGVEELFEPVEAQYVRLRVRGTDTNPLAGSGYRIDEFEVWTAGPDSRNAALASAGAQATGDSRVAEDFAGAYSAALAIDGMFGAPWIASGPELTIKLPRPEMIQRVLFSSDRTGAGGDQSVVTFVGEYQLFVSEDGQHWTEVAGSATRQPVTAAHRKRRLIDRVTSDDQRRRRAQLVQDLNAVKGQVAAVAPLTSWWVGQFQAAPGPYHVFLGGNPQRAGDEVVPHCLTALAGVTQRYELSPETPESQRREQLARWITGQGNPLAARVLANRVWHYHFGTGIVDTPSDFGFMGGRPTHPALLDYLAGQLLEAGWRLKPLHRQIMLSETYRQSGAFRGDAAAKDGDSRYLWRFPPRRLTAEELRDSMLLAAGKLDRTAGGPGFRLYHYMQDNVATYVPLDTYGPETYRRSVYHQNARATRIDLMTEYDAPDCAFAAPRRASTTTPLQALTLMNHSFTLDMAAALAERSAADEVTEMVRCVFQHAFARLPTDQEQRAAARLVEAHGLPALCRAIFNSNEFVYVD